MPRFALQVAYDGRSFHGSQVQENAATVQGALQDAMALIFRQPVTLFGASRTDEGVHAKANFYHFDAPAALHPQFQYKLNAILPAAIAVTHIWETAADFNCRFDAVRRQYRYRVYNRKNPFLEGRAYFYPYLLNEALLHQTAGELLLHSDFESFCKRTTTIHSFQCKIFSARWEAHEDELHFVVEANRFLRGMVRGLVGTQLRAARKGNAGDFRQVILAKDCTKADFSVPGHGLYLEQIVYGEGALILRGEGVKG